MKKLVGLVALLAVAGCRSLDVSYLPPASGPTLDYKRSIQADFDTTWSALIDHASTTFFTIENFEKDSGLLILTFGASDIPAYVDCGQWSYHYYQQESAISATHVDFDGSYAQWLASEVGASLVAKMNIRVRKVSSNRTDVIVSARYVLADSTGDRWVFSSGNSATIQPRNRTPGSPPTRTCQPTHKAERSIIEALDAIASAH